MRCVLAKSDEKMLGRIAGSRFAGEREALTVNTRVVPVKYVIDCDEILYCTIFLQSQLT